MNCNLRFCFSSYKIPSYWTEAATVLQGLFVLNVKKQEFVCLINLYQKDIVVFFIERILQIDELRKNIKSIQLPTKLHTTESLVTTDTLTLKRTNCLQTKRSVLNDYYLDNFQLSAPHLSRKIRKVIENPTKKQTLNRIIFKCINQGV